MENINYYFQRLLKSRILSVSFFWIISLLFTVIFSVTGPFVQFFPLFLNNNGLNASQISIAMSFLALSKIFATVTVAFFIDRSPKPHWYLAFTAGFTAFIWLLISVFDLSGLILIPLTLLFSFTWSASVPLSEGFSVRACRLSPDLDYGRMRLFGSAAFVISGFICGMLIDYFGMKAFSIYIYVACLGVAILALKMPNFYDIERKNGIALPTTNFDVIKKLISNKNYLYIVFGAGIMHAGHAVFLQSAAIEWQRVGYSGETIAFFFAIGVVAEIVLFYFGSSLEKNITTVGFFVIAAIASIIRWVGMSLEPNLVNILLLQSLHAFTFGALHLGCVRYFKDNLPDGTLGAAQLIYGAVMWGIVMIPAAIASGYLYDNYGVRAYLPMAFVVLLGLGVMLLAHNKHFTRYQMLKTA